jgi:hypothetical protein
VANREQWTVATIGDDDQVTVVSPDGRSRILDPLYVQDNVQHAWAVTAHGAQGATVDRVHAVVSDRMDAAGLYVGLTRGRSANVLHAVAEDEGQARSQFLRAARRSNADPGLHAARAAAERRMAKAAEKSAGAAQEEPVAEPRKRSLTTEGTPEEIMARFEAEIDRDPSVQGVAGDLEQVFDRDPRARVAEGARRDQRLLDHPVGRFEGMGRDQVSEAVHDRVNVQSDWIPGADLLRAPLRYPDPDLTRRGTDLTDEETEYLCQAWSALGRPQTASEALSAEQARLALPTAGEKGRGPAEQQPVDDAEAVEAEPKRRREFRAAGPEHEDARQEEPAESAAPEEQDAGQPFRSGLRDARAVSDRRKAALAALADLEEDYRGREPDAAFETRAKAIGVRHSVLEKYGQHMGEEFRSQLHDRAVKRDERSDWFERKKDYLGKLDTPKAKFDPRFRTAYNKEVERSQWTVGEIETELARGDYRQVPASEREAAFKAYRLERFDLQASGTEADNRPARPVLSEAQRRVRATREELIKQNREQEQRTQQQDHSYGLGD